MRTPNAVTPLVRLRHPMVLTTGLLGLIIVGAAFLTTRQPTKGALGARTPEAAGVPVRTATATQEKLPFQITAVDQDQEASTVISCDAILAGFLQSAYPL